MIPAERVSEPAAADPVLADQPSGGHAKRLGGDVAIYGSGRIALQLLAFLTLPVLTNVFSKAEYGVIETAAIVFSVVMFVAPLGLEAASQRSYFDYSDDQVAERRLVLGTTAWTMAAFSSLLGASVVLASSFLSRLLLGNADQAMLFVLVGVTVPVATMLTFVQEVLRLRRRPVQYVALAMLLGVLSTAATLYLVLVADVGVRAIFTATLFAMTCALVIGFPFVARHVSRGFSRREIRVMLAYGLPMVPVAAATWAIQLVDRFFLLAYYTTAELGVYSLGAKYANLLLLLIYAFGAAYSPFMLDLHSRDPAEERRVRAKLLSVFTFFLTWAAVAVTASSRTFLEMLTGVDFRDAYQVVGLISVACIAIGMNSIVMAGISLSRKTHYFLRYTAYAAVANVVLNFLLIPPFGMVGAAAATVLTYVLLTSLYSWRAQRLDRAEFEWKRIAGIVVAGGLCLVPANLMLLRPMSLDVAFKCAIIVAFPFVAAAFGGLHPDTIATLRRVASYVRGRRAPA